MNAIKQWNVLPVIMVNHAKVAIMEMFFGMELVFVKVISIRVIMVIVRRKL